MTVADVIENTSVSAVEGTYCIHGRLCGSDMTCCTTLNAVEKYHMYSLVVP